ncbi:MAG: hypothetical protein R3C61_02525 [Bacteroidia bacterium]
MSNPFKSLESEKELPESVKDQTMGNVYAAKMIMDIVDLFVGKVGLSAQKLINPGASVHGTIKPADSPAQLDNGIENSPNN